MVENFQIDSAYAAERREQYNILIIDDDTADRVLYKKYIENFDQSSSYVFYDAKSGQEGLEIFQKIQVDCILLDYILPDISGLDVLKEMMKVSPILPVLMLTGQGSEEIAAETIKCGAQDYVSKNIITAEALCRAIRSTINRSCLLNKVANQNEQLKYAKEKAEKADRTKSEFLATMSHEIRTPLNGIIGMSELMNYTPMSDKQKKYMYSISTSGELLLTIINDILDFSKIEAGDFELEHRDVDLQSLVRDVFQLLSASASENRVKLILDWPCDLDILIIQSDPIRLRQILINLMSNAVKFTKDGVVILKFRLEQSVLNQAVLRFEIQDTGIGIPEDKIDDIFIQFSQVDSSTTREYGGTGLGLAISKKLIELMREEIGVESEVGEGTIFWFETPIEASLVRSIAQDNYGHTLNGKRILLVDDHQINLDLLSSYLQPHGADIDIALSGQDALSKMSEAKCVNKAYDLILADYAMPHMDGKVLGKKIKDNVNEYGSANFLLLTDMGKKQSLKILENSGFSATLTKPIYPGTLLKALVECVDSEFRYVDADIHVEDCEAQPIKRDLHILVVDDDRISMRMSCSILDELGCTYETALNGKEALSVLEKSHAKYDCVFMDWQMPVMDGHEAIRSIRQEKWGEGLKVIALTANAIQGDKEKCIDAGASAYLSKPVRVADIVGSFESLSL